MPNVTNIEMQHDAAVPTDVFAAPANSRALTESALRRSLVVLGEDRLRRAEVLLPPLRKVREENWTGATKGVQQELERYRADAEALTAVLAGRVEDLLLQARLQEQAAGAVARSALYDAVSQLFTDAGIPEWEAELQPLLEKLAEPEKLFHERLHSVATGKIGKGAAYTRLVTASDVALRDGSDLVRDRCRRMLHARIAAYASQRIANIRTSRRLLVDSARDTEKTRVRRQALESTRIARGETALRHDASIPPRPEVIEHAVLGAVAFVAGDHLRLDTFWVQFGAWCTARGELPAEQTSTADAPPLADAIRVFLREQAQKALACLTLGEIYAATGTTLPLPDLQDRSLVPVDLLNVANLAGAAHQEVRVAAVPANMAGVHLAAGWIRAASSNPNRLKFVHDFRGFSARAVLGAASPEWQAALDEAAIDQEASTPLLQSAVHRARIVERLRGAPHAGPSTGTAVPAELSRPAASGDDDVRDAPEKGRLLEVAGRLHGNGAPPADAPTS